MKGSSIVLLVFGTLALIICGAIAYSVPQARTISSNIVFIHMFFTIGGTALVSAGIASYLIVKTRKACYEKLPTVWDWNGDPEKNKKGEYVKIIDHYDGGTVHWYVVQRTQRTTPDIGDNDSTDVNIGKMSMPKIDYVKYSKTDVFHFLTGKLLRR